MAVPPAHQPAGQNTTADSEARSSWTLVYRITARMAAGPAAKLFFCPGKRVGQTSPPAQSPRQPRLRPLSAQKPKVRDAAVLPINWMPEREMGCRKEKLGFGPRLSGFGYFRRCQPNRRK